MSRFASGGFSLIEVLVSVLILAAGIVGTAGMQLSATRTAQQSAFHTHALHLATEMADTIRAFQPHAQDTAGTNPFVGIEYKSATDNAAEPPAKLCYLDDCNAQELAEFEIYDWKSRLKTMLPQGRLLVCLDASPQGDDAKSMSWDCDGGTKGTAPVVIKLGWQAKNPDGSLIRGAERAFPPTAMLAIEG